MTVTLVLEGQVFGPTEDIEWQADFTSGSKLSDSAALAPGDPSEITLTYTDVPADSDFTLFVPAWEAGFRTNQGGYIAPRTLELTTPA